MCWRSSFSVGRLVCGLHLCLPFDPAGKGRRRRVEMMSLAVVFKLNIKRQRPITNRKQKAGTRDLTKPKPNVSQTFKTQGFVTLGCG